MPCNPSDERPPELASGQTVPGRNVTGGAACAEREDDDLPDAVVSYPCRQTKVAGPGSTAAQKSTLMRGFLGRAGSRRLQDAERRPNLRCSSRPVDQLAHLTVPADAEQPEHITRVSRDLRAQSFNESGKQASGGRGLQQLRIVPDASAAEALAPTPQVMQQVLADKDLLAGYDDVAVMAAVADIAAHPEHAARHLANPKVASFYRNMQRFAEQQSEQSSA